MTEVRKVVRLHPTTVAEYQRHVKRAQYSMRMMQELSVMKVDIRVWKAAMGLAKGDATRIVAISEDEVIVVNQSKRKG